MKRIKDSISKIDCVSVAIGIVIGIFLVIGFFCIKKYFFYTHFDKRGGYSMNEKMNKRMGHMNHMMGSTTNPYMMDVVRSEKQFLLDMIMHHEAAVIMSQQVLSLAPAPSKDVASLANAIIETQTKEIANMKEWLNR